MTIGLFGQFLMERQDVAHEVTLELLYVLSPALAVLELPPCLKEIFERDDILIAMSVLKEGHALKRTPPHALLPVLERLKSAYILWYGFYQTIPKIHRHSLGQRIDSLFVEVIEAISIASYLPREEKHPWVRLAIRKLDTSKILVMVMWETKSLDNKKYLALSAPLEEIGRMLGGWQGQLTKQNSPAKAGEK